MFIGYKVNFLINATNSSDLKFGRLYLNQISDMIHIPENIQELKSYKPGKPLPQIIKELNLSEVAVLWNNENNFGPSPRALECIAKATPNSHLYPDPVCTELRTLLAKKWNRSFDEVAVGNGSESIFNNLFNAFFKEGEELLTCEGTFVAVYIWAKANNVKVSTVPLNQKFGFDLDALLGSINDKTKAIGIAVMNRFIQSPIHPEVKCIGKAVKIPVIRSAIIKAIKNCAKTMTDLDWGGWGD